MADLPDLIVRTSDRGTFRRCRRLWGWSSALKGNLEPRDRPDVFWIGTGVHFALEDFHGHKRYPSAAEAFYAYSRATVLAAEEDPERCSVPIDLPEFEKLSIGMMDYYERQWLVGRDPIKTYVIDGRPQVEITFSIPLPVATPEGYGRVMYQGTFDRIAIDQHDRLWIVEYKTAKDFSTGHFDTDPQVNAYAWAAHCIYDLPVAGVIYQQHKKVLPEYPRLLSSTGRYSTDKRQYTTHRLYRDALIKQYGVVNKAPAANVQFLNHLASEEQEEGDRLIRRDRVYRNMHQIAAEGEKVLMEVQDMLRTDLALYPSPTRDCAHYCRFYNACVSIDDGSDWEEALNDIARPRMGTEYEAAWRNYIVYPATTVIHGQ